MVFGTAVKQIRIITITSFEITENIWTRYTEEAGWLLVMIKTIAPLDYILIIFFTLKISSSRTFS
jgi:hypothetical protein